MCLARKAGSRASTGPPLPLVTGPSEPRGQVSFCSTFLSTLSPRPLRASGADPQSKGPHVPDLLHLGDNEQSDKLREQYGLENTDGDAAKPRPALREQSSDNWTVSHRPSSHTSLTWSPISTSSPRSAPPGDYLWILQCVPLAGECQKITTATLTWHAKKTRQTPKIRNT